MGLRQILTKKKNCDCKVFIEILKRIKKKSTTVVRD